MCVCVYLDDILISSSSRNEHLCTLQNVLERLSKHGVHLQKDKCDFEVLCVKYVGHIIDGAGLRPLPEKVEALISAPKHRNKPVVTMCSCYALLIIHIYIKL